LEEFALDMADLVRRDCHYILYGKDNVNTLSGSDKQAWVRGIQITPSSQTTAETETNRQRDFMISFFMTACLM
jgi:hypothetical protein